MMNRLMQCLLTCKCLGKAPPAVAEENLQRPEMLPPDMLQEDDKAAMRQDIPPAGRIINVSTGASMTSAVSQFCQLNPRLTASIFILYFCLMVGKRPLPCKQVFLETFTRQHTASLEAHSSNMRDIPHHLLKFHNKVNIQKKHLDIGMQTCRQPGVIQPGESHLRCW